jgi:hypothetical protein
MSKSVELKTPTYTIQLKYSEEATEKKLMKFITPSGDFFEISSDEMIRIMMEQVNQDTLTPAFVEMDRINVVEVARQLECELTEDMKAGQKIRLNYKHPYPVEFALIEEAMKIAKINMDVPITTLTVEYLESVRDRIKPVQENFMKKFYSSFKNLGSFNGTN